MHTQKDMYQAVVQLQKRQDKIEQDYKKLYTLLSTVVISQEKISPFIQADMSNDNSGAMKALVQRLQDPASLIGQTVRNLISEKQDTFLYGHMSEGLISYNYTSQEGDEVLKLVHGDLYIAENGDLLHIKDGVCICRFNAHSSCDFDWRIYGTVDHVYIHGCSGVTLTVFKNIELVDCTNVVVNAEDVSLFRCQDMNIQARDVHCRNCINVDVNHSGVDLSGVQGYVISDTFTWQPETMFENTETPYDPENQRVNNVYGQIDFTGKKALYASMYDSSLLSNAGETRQFAVKVGLAKDGAFLVPSIPVDEP